MTKHELVEAYSRGEIDRRSFVTKLTALGIGSAAAFAYATQLAPSSSASTGFSGFIRQEGVEADDDYGTAVVLESDEEAVEAATAGEQLAQAVVADIIDNYSAEDFDGFESNGINVFEQLQLLQAHLSDHQASLAGILPGFTVPSTSGGVPSGVAGNLEAELQVLHDVLETLASLYAGLTPAVEDPELSQTLANIAVVKGRHVAFLAMLLGIDPIADSFEEPIGPDEALAELESILGS